MKAKVTKVKGGIDLELTCPTCGGDITRTSKKFGMDCAKRCGEKEYKALTKKLGKDPLDSLVNELKRMGGL